MDKTNSFCPHFPSCPSCAVPEVTETSTIKEARHFFSTHEISSYRLHVGQTIGWRCRAKLAVRGTAKEPLIGLFEPGSHHIIDLPRCQAHHPLINQAIEYVRQWMKEFGIEPYDEKIGKGVLRYLEFAIDREANRVQLVLVLNQRQDQAMAIETQNRAFRVLWERYPNLWHSLWLNFNKRRDNVILGNLWKLLYGKEWLWDRFCGRRVCFHPASFAQANPEMFEQLLAALEKYVPQGTHVVEFYAGGGAIGLTLVDKCQTIYFNEIVELAEKCFEESCKELSLQQVNKLRYVCGPAEKQTEILDGDVDVVIVDPPRKGIDELLIHKLSSSTTIQRLIYVSCGWVSFQRDCQKLLESGWRMVSAEAFLFFPGSDHLEILAIFDKAEREGGSG